MSDAKERILQAAIDEFGLHGYNEASTNKILVKAEVSKGLIFHYYGNKKELYLACVKYVFDYLTNHFEKAFTSEETDFFARVLDIIKFKVNFLTEHPEMGRLLLEVNKIYYEKSMPEITECVDEGYKGRMAVVSRGIDVSQYRKDIPAEKLFDFILTVIDAFTDRCHFEQMPYEKMEEHVREYFKEIEIVKKILTSGIYEGK